MYDRLLAASDLSDQMVLPPSCSTCTESAGSLEYLRHTKGRRRCQHIKGRHGRQHSKPPWRSSLAALLLALVPAYLQLLRRGLHVARCLNSADVARCLNSADVARCLNSADVARCLQLLRYGQMLASKSSCERCSYLLSWADVILNINK